jgi:hypothetical protein
MEEGLINDRKFKYGGFILHILPLNQISNKKIVDVKIQPLIAII